MAYLWNQDIFLKTEHPVAVDSFEQVRPGGSVQDFTDGSQFASELLSVFNDRKTLLDLGSSTGFMPMSMRKAGMLAVGLEGCDAPNIQKLGAWKDMPEVIRNCDISHPFQIVTRKGQPVRFDYITSWSVFEHIQPERLPTLFDNIKRHLEPDGFIILNIDMTPDGTKYHKNIQTWDQWRDILKSHFVLDELTMWKWDWHFPRPSPEEIARDKKLNGPMCSAKGDKTYWWLRVR